MAVVVVVAVAMVGGWGLLWRVVVVAVVVDGVAVIAVLPSSCRESDA